MELCFINIDLCFIKNIINCGEEKMLLLNEYHEDISKLHVNMMERRSYYIPFINTNEALNIKDTAPK